MADNPKCYTVISYAHVYLFMSTNSGRGFIFTGGGASFYRLTYYIELSLNMWYSKTIGPIQFKFTAFTTYR